MDNIQIISIITEPRQIQALFKLMRRAPMTDAEACFVEDLFNGWFVQMRDQQNQTQALARMATLAHQAPDGKAVSDVLSSDPSSDPLDATLPYDGVERTVN